MHFIVLNSYFKRYENDKACEKKISIKRKKNLMNL